MNTRALLLRFSHLALLLTSVACASLAYADDGYRLWLRYEPISDATVRQNDAAACGAIAFPAPSPTLRAARAELVDGLRGLLNEATMPADAFSDRARLLVGTPESLPALRTFGLDAALARAGDEGYVLLTVGAGDRARIVIAANHDIGVLYGVFAFLRQLQTARPIASLDLVSAPKIQRRLLDHWDDLNGFISRGHAGFSLWDWFQLPDYVSPRLKDYARADASIGINGAVLTNVNADARVLTEDFARRAAAIADTFRPYGVRVYLTARFSAPVDLGELKTADPLDPAVRAWWKARIDDLYRYIPDFGGFLVKANSEGEPGPQQYGRSHADGANMLAEALAPHGGIVMWRAFVYDDKVADDRAKQAYNEFTPLDGKFRDNVIVQIKNGPIDFMPREPFHPLFGAMPKTPLALELQITQEYLGGSVQLVYLAPLFKECLASDTYKAGPGTTVAKVIDGSIDHHTLTAIAGVANTGSDRNWTGHPMAQANWYAYGRLAWDHELEPAEIADEWIRMTFSNTPRVVDAIKPILLESREAVVNYSMPLGLHHIMARGHHYGPGPWVSGGRADWTSPYYHRADANGIGFERTAKGSNAVSQYAPEVAQRWSDLATCPDELLLWFHHLPWDYRMRSGRTLWDELCLHYQTGVNAVRTWQSTWDRLQPLIDPERFSHVKVLLARQERDAREWRDACIQYFQTFSRRPFPAEVERPELPLEYYEKIDRQYVPGWKP